MCANFHPKEDLVVSASLDQTVRVWDISGLRKKSAAGSGGGPPRDEFSARTAPGNSGNQADLFGNTDALVKYVLEGHERGVNWASFHPTLPLIVSGADDRQVKLWRMSDTKAWEVDTCRGHFNNVSCVIFHPRLELIVSNSEDKTIRVWDTTKRTALASFRRENERFWIITAHPELNLFAAGHDNGLIVFKLERERPAMGVHGNQILYIKDKYLRSYDFEKDQDNALIGIRKTAGLNMQHRTLAYNPAENCVLVTTPADGGMYEIYQLPTDTRGSNLDTRDASNDCKRGPGNSAVFVARNRYAVFVKSTQQLTLKNLNNDQSKVISLPYGNVEDIFAAGTGTILLSTPTSVILYDLQNQEKLVELVCPPVKYVSWSFDNSMVALIGKHTIVIANKKLEQLSTIHETIRIKSGVWDDSGIFVYSTLNHIKYALPEGDNGIIKTLEQPVYITRVHGKNIFCIDRDGKSRTRIIDPTEYRFKSALLAKRYDEVLNIIKNSNLCGQSIISYLRAKGYPEVALQFVRENRTRFDLAVECGNMEVAVETAKIIDREDCWRQLAQAALFQGNIPVVELAYQRVKDFESLSFLYMITGNSEKLKKMAKIAELREDHLNVFHNSLYLGDIEEQIKVLQNVGQAQLAYSMAKRYGFNEIADSILEAAGKTKDQIEDFPTSNTVSLVPQKPLNATLDSSWPLMTISRGLFEGAAPITAPKTANPDEEKGGWGDDDLDIGNEPKTLDAALASMGIQGGETADAGWGDIDDELGLSEVEHDVEAISSPSGITLGNEFVVPSAGVSTIEQWIRNSPLACDHIAAGAFESAMQILNRQVGATNFAPLKPFFLNIYQASRASFNGLPLAASTLLPLNSNWQEKEVYKLSPVSPYRYDALSSMMQLGMQATTAGRFSDALSLFKRLLHSILMTSTLKKTEADEMANWIQLSREYILGLSLEIARKELSASENAENLKRSVELAAYFTHCQLDPKHVILSLNLAMAQAYKIKCYQSASIFVRRLLELGPDAAIVTRAKKLQAVVEKSPRDEVALQYDPLTPFVICAATYVPIYKGSQSLTCSYCGASYVPSQKDHVCVVCEVGKVGGSGTGLRVMI